MRMELPPLSLLRDLRNQNALEIDFRQSNTTGTLYFQCILIPKVA